MSDMELIEIEFTETTVETENVWLNLAINFGVTVAGVLAGNAICWGAGKIVDTVKEKKQEINDIEESKEAKHEVGEELTSETHGDSTIKS